MDALPLRRSLRLLWVLLGVLAVIAIASTTCARPDDRSLPPPSSTSSTQPEPTTSTVDRSRLVLQPVAGETTTTLAETGDASLRGVVVGPDGPVPEAIVRVERLVGDAVQLREVRAGADGAYAVEGIPGGRLRVRAYLPPSLTMAAPEIFFLEADEPRELRLQLTLFEGPDVRASTAPTAPSVGGLVNLLVWVAERVVDEEGVARTVPVAGVPVEVRSTGWTFVEGRPVTDGDGVALFTYRCDRIGPVTATALIGTEPEVRTYPLEVPACGPRPTTTTTTTTTPADDDEDDEDTTTTETTEG
ncbi:MAG: hypothetical protein ACLGIC_12710 [Acidimicrobiia bacterium]